MDRLVIFISNYMSITNTPLLKDKMSHDGKSLMLNQYLRYLSAGTDALNMQADCESDNPSSFDPQDKTDYSST